METEKGFMMRDSAQREREYIPVWCNLCGNDDAVVFGELSDRTTRHLHYRSVKCRKCGLVYANPQASVAKRAAYYSTIYPESVVPDYIKRMERLAPKREEFFRELEQRGIQPGRLLDIGCAAGHFLDAAREFGWEVYGVELSETFVQYARQYFGLEHVSCGEFGRSVDFEDEFFDYVNMWHVLEHVPDPTATLAEIHRILHREGELRIGVPTYASPHVYFDRFLCRLRREIPGLYTSSDHTYNFTPFTLRRMLEKNGFAVKQLRVYYNPGVLAVTANTNWKGKVEKKVTQLLAKVFSNRWGDRIEARARKR